jgi:hypothetical protein
MDSSHGCVICGPMSKGTFGKAAGLLCRLAHPRRRRNRWCPTQRPVPRHLLDGTTQFSRPLVPTVQIPTGPQVQCRYGHFVALDRPAHDRFGFVGPTFWAGHFSAPFQGILRVGYHWMKRMKLVISLEALSRSMDMWREAPLAPGHSWRSWWVRPFL